MNNISKTQRIQGAIWGAIVGDAYGCPYEFSSRASLKSECIIDMAGDRSHGQPPGTFTDDGSLLLASADSLSHKTFDLQDMGERFVAWRETAKYSARGSVFDIGGATSGALSRISSGVPAEQAGGVQERDCGNGSLMRVLPVCIRFSENPTDEFIDRIERASALTHAHPIAKLGCVFYGLMVRQILEGQSALNAFNFAFHDFYGYYEDSAYAEWLPKFDKLLGLAALGEDSISSGGYVLDSLFASLWCLLTTDNYEDCIRLATSLGGDTDTTSCIAGGIAGALFGYDAIPKHWLSAIPQDHTNVDAIVSAFVDACNGKLLVDVTPEVKPNDVSVIASGKFLELVSKDGWEFARRKGNVPVVAVVATTMNPDVVILTEQFRIPVGKNVIDLPAGLVDAGEMLTMTALRELEEETGATTALSGNVRIIGAVPTSPGMSSEIVTLVRVEYAKMPEDDAGYTHGVGGETIIAHEVQLSRLFGFLAEKMEAGCLIDPKVYTGLCLAGLFTIK